GGFGGGQVGRALDGMKTGVGGEGENLGRIGGDDPAADQFGGDGVVEGVGDDGAAQEGQRVLVFESDAAGAGHDDRQDVWREQGFHIGALSDEWERIRYRRFAPIAWSLLKTLPLAGPYGILLNIRCSGCTGCGVVAHVW